MKKILSLLLALALVLTMSLTAFATDFVESPGSSPAPSVVESSAQSPECTVDIVVTPYDQRDDLDEEKSETLEEAYQQILEAAVVSDLCPDLTQVAEDLGVAVQQLAVSSLFDLDNSGCSHDKHVAGEHGSYRIKLSGDNLTYFAGVIHLRNMVWELVENARLVDGEFVEFEVEDFSPFAIVTVIPEAAAAETPAEAPVLSAAPAAEAAPEAPVLSAAPAAAEGGNAGLFGIIALVLVCVAAAAVVLGKKKSSK